MATKLTKQINNQFIPTYTSGYPVFMYGGSPKQYALGSWIKDKALPFIGDGAKLYADNMLSVFGASDVIKDDAYKNKAFKDISGVTSGLFGAAGQIGANLIAPGVGGALMGSVQQGVGQLTAPQVNELKMQSVSNLPAQPSYISTFADGGDMTFMQPMDVNLNPILDTNLIPIPTNRIYDDSLRFRNNGPTYRMEANKLDSYINKYEKQLNKLGGTSKEKVLGKIRETNMLKEDLLQHQLNPDIKKFAGGGMLNSYSNSMIPISDRLSEIKSGSTHEQSPYNGVPVTNNALVEDGEVIFKGKNGKKYVFSNRLIYEK